MTCSQIEKKLAVSEPLTSAESAHVQKCQNCSAFLRGIKVFTPAVKIKTPQEVRLRTLQTSVRALESEPEFSKASLFERLWQTPQTAFILAGFSILALIVVVLYQLDCDQTNLVCRVSALLLIIILVQNIITAFCLPLLIQHKKTIYYN